MGFAGLVLVGADFLVGPILPRALCGATLSQAVFGPPRRAVSISRLHQALASSQNQPNETICRMRVLLQRVSRATVRIREAGAKPRLSGHIGRGYLLLVGFTATDVADHAVWMAEKVIGLRLFADAEDKMNLSLSDVGGAILVVSQFTLYGDARKGRRPSFIDAARPEQAIPLYERFIQELRLSGLGVETGEFGAMMDVELVNDGPVTLWLER